MKKSRFNENDNCIIAVYADDKKGLLGQILNIFNKRSYNVNSLNVSRTDIREIVLITIEAELPLNELQGLLSKIEKVIEVYNAIAYMPGELILNKVGFYRVAIQLMSDDLWLLLQKYGAVVSKIFEGSFVIQKTGTDDDLDELYSHLECEHLLSFCKSTLIVEKSLVQLDKYFDRVVEDVVA